MAVRGITFDFWDTIVDDDTDEPVRAARGLPSKAEARVSTFVDEVVAHHPQIGREAARAALETASSRFRHHWKVEHHTPCVADRLMVGFESLGIGRTPGYDGLVHAWESMEVEIPPKLVDGIGDCLAALQGQYKIGIISDAIVTPGTGLRQILKDYGLFKYFDHFVFSDEAGASKPAARVFDLACAGLGVAPSELAHVGDRPANDIRGPNDYGAYGVLYTGVVDRRVDGDPEPAVVVAHMDQMAEAIAGLGQ
jgi:HAD superfamily hydrolase (TIGR01549 family)